MASVDARQRYALAEAELEARLVVDYGPGVADLAKRFVPGLWKQAIRIGPDNAMKLLAPVLNKLTGNKSDNKPQDAKGLPF